MRRRALIAVGLLAVAGALLFAGCGYEGTVSAAPETVQGPVPQETTPTVPEGPEGDPAKGAELFGTCSGCHTLAAADATGVVGPNLDQTKPDLALTIDRVTNGRGNMPSFKESLSPQEIADVAAFVFESTRGG